MEYTVTQKAVDEWVFDELWTLEVMVAVDSWAETMVKQWYLTK